MHSGLIARPPRASRPRQARGGTLLGVLIGFALGVAVAGVIAFFFTKKSKESGIVEQLLRLIVKRPQIGQ